MPAGGKKSSVSKAKKPATPRNRKNGGKKHFPVVGIGASAGGYEAFIAFLKALRTDTGFAFVFVQHQDPNHDSNLSNLLKRSTEMPVHLTADRMEVEPNSVYVIPPNADMTIENGTLRLTPRRAGRIPHLPIDLFFQSLAEHNKRTSIGVILSGTASDGTLGLQAIKASGGITFAQDENSAKYPGMPHNAVASQVVDFVLPPEMIAKELGKMADHPVVQEVLEKEVIETANDQVLAGIFGLLRKHSGVDFSHYKPSTIIRRLQRRMLLHRLDTLDKYLRFLKENPKSVATLYEDILINVTHFFRDPDTFETLKSDIFPKMLMGLGPHEKVFRVWVPACSSGEEAYSIAIAFQEHLTARGKTGALQIFGTDISEISIEKARTGVYPLSIAAHVSPERLRRFFTQTDQGYQINKSIRDICIFARHNVLKDPPFSRIDLLSCRNLLIYLGPVLQKKLLPIFHYALNPNGYLMLGSSESIRGFSDYFFPADKKYKIHSRKSTVKRTHFELTEPFDDGRRPTPFPGKQVEPVTSKDILREGDRLILSRYAPASVIVDDNFEILQFRGKTGTYLEPAPGQASLNIMKMAREGVIEELRAALLQARKEKVVVHKEGLMVRVNGGTKTFDLEVSPYSVPRSNQYFYLVFFDDRPQVDGVPAVAKPKKPPNKDQEELIRLRAELTSSREYLQSIIEEREAANEELRAANEEILSSNEELQSTNEEMETAKEELQSANEELTTVNEELQVRNIELNRANDDLTNLLSSVFIPIVMLGRDLRIRRFTPMAEKIFNLIPADIGRPITDINLSVDIQNVADQLVEVIDSVVIKNVDVQDKLGRWYNLQMRPYKTIDNKIDGAVLALFDIDSLKHEKSRRFDADLVALIETLHEPVVLLDERFRILAANSVFVKSFHLKPDKLEGQLFGDIDGGKWNLPKIKSLLIKSLKDSNVGVASFDSEFKGADQKKLHCRGRRLKLGNGQTVIFFAVNETD